MALIVPCGTIMRQGQKRPLASSQIRAARALVKWSAEDLARQSSVSLRTIRRAELAEPETSMTAPNDTAIRRAFEMAGIEFIDENGGGAGGGIHRRRCRRLRGLQQVDGRGTTQDRSRYEEQPSPTG
jgi:transcriptional regulator with XRE-family HTH domain